MEKVTLSARVILGLMFFVFGLNGFLQFMPMPEPSEAGGVFLGALAATGYFFPVMKIVEIISGALLLAGRFVGLALVLISPVVVQIFLYHAALDASGMGLAILLVILTAYLGFYGYRSSFDGILSSGAGGGGGGDAE